MSEIKQAFQDLIYGGKLQDKMITYLLGALGLGLVVYGATHDMIGWSLPTYATY